MAATLGAVFVALGVSAILGYVVGYTMAATEREVPTDGGEADHTERLESRGAAAEADDDLAARLARAEDDLAAHAVELATANEEITVLLERLHEARSSRSS